MFQPLIGTHVNSGATGCGLLSLKKRMRLPKCINVKIEELLTLSHYMICCTLLHSACTYLHAVCCEDVRTVTLAPPWTLVALMAGLCDTSALVTEST